jgi:hypothetical protein
MELSLNKAGPATGSASLNLYAIYSFIEKSKYQRKGFAWGE